MHFKNINEHIEEMKNAANTLVQHSFPLVPLHESKKVDCLKQRIMWIDGYLLAAYFGRCDFGDYYLEKLELVSMSYPFLPMYLLCKIGAKFLGGYGLRLTEQYYAGRKVYTWDVKVDKTGKPIPITQDRDESYDFEGFTFSHNKM